MNKDVLRCETVLAQEVSYDVVVTTTNTPVGGYCDQIDIFS